MACTGAGGQQCGECERYQDVVCSWQRVTVPEGNAGAGAGPVGCDAAEPLFDPSGAPLGGAGGAYPDRNACAASFPEQTATCNGRCLEVTSQKHLGECTILGHCCVLMDVTYCAGG
jgi:hypothetical protein